MYITALFTGSMRELDVIDVAKQSDMKMLMREFVEYYNKPQKDRILNVISLEFSNTRYNSNILLYGQAECSVMIDIFKKHIRNMHFKVII